MSLFTSLGRSFVIETCLSALMDFIAFVISLCIRYLYLVVSLVGQLVIALVR